MPSPDRPHRSSFVINTLLAVAMTTVASPLLLAQNNPQIDKILSERDENKKGQMAVKFRQGGIDADDVMRLLQREKMDSIAALVTGEYLEKGSFEPGKTALTVKALAARKDMLGKAVAMAAFSPHNANIVEDFMRSRAHADRMIAAYILATWAWSEALYADDAYIPPDDVEAKQAEARIAELEKLIAEEEAKAKENPDATKDLTEEQKKAAEDEAKKRDQELKQLKRFLNQHVPRPQLLKRGHKIASLDIEPMLKELLDERSGDVLELAVLAAAWARLEALREPVEKLRISARDAGVEAVRQLYLGRIGRPIDHEAIGRVLTIESRKRPDVRYTKLTPMLHSYDVRGTPLLYTLQAIATAGKTEHLDQLHELLSHEDLRVQQDAARAIGAVGDEKSLPVLFAALNRGIEQNDDTRRRKEEPIAWPVKVAVLDAIGAIPARSSVEPLIAARDRERGRLRLDVNHALASIARQQAGETADAWRTWWKENGDKVKIDRELTAQWRRRHRVQDMTAPALTTFYGSAIVSDRVVFVLDTSASMKGDKIDTLKSNMQETLEGVVDYMYFNVVDFGGSIRVMNPGSLISAKFGYKVADMVQELDLSLGTRTYDAMEVGMLLPEADTVMYLSDGAPVTGQFEEWDALRRGLALFNRYHPLSIHALYYSKGGGRRNAKNGNALQMMLLADHNAGLMTMPK